MSATSHALDILTFTREISSGTIGDTQWGRTGLDALNELQTTLPWTVWRSNYPALTKLAEATIGEAIGRHTGTPQGATGTAKEAPTQANDSGASGISPQPGEHGDAATKPGKIHSKQRRKASDT